MKTMVERIADSRLRTRATSLLGDVALWCALGLILIWPAAATVYEAMRPDGDQAATITESPGTAGVPRPLALAATSLRVTLVAVGIACAVGIPSAVLLFRTDVWGRGGLLALLALAAFVPLPLHATAWLGAFGNAGRSQLIGGAPWLIDWWGAAVVHALAALPWVVFIAGVGLRTVEPELEELALLDRGAARVLFGVTLRRALGALAGAALAAAVLTSGEMTITDLLQVRTYAEEAYTRKELGHGPAAAAAVALPPLVVLGGLVLLTARGLLRMDPARLAAATSRGRLWRLGRLRFPLGVIFALTVGNIVALPMYGLILRAGRVGPASAGGPPAWTLGGVLGTLRRAAPEVLEPFAVSATISALAAGLAVLVAWPLAWKACRPSVWRWVAAGAAALGFATPGPVVGMAFVLAYRDVGALYSSNAIIILAVSARALPFALLVLWPTLRTMPRAYFEAAELDGDGPWQRWARVALPLSAGATAAAWGMSFLFAMGELAATKIVEPPGTETLTRFLWSLLHTGVESHLAGVALVMLAALAVVEAAMLAAARAWSTRVRPSE